LMDAFVASRDQRAFAALVQRHGPMVLGVCRRILGHVQDAEDAFQAVFWVLARKAGSVRPRGHVGNWLYGVAVRTALKARCLRRRRREHPVSAMPPLTSENEINHDEHALLDQEIERLPAKYRLAVVLCELEGKSRAEAAAQLHVPEGTLSSRLAYARKLLARRLQARGVALSAGGLALAGPAVPQALLASAAQAASASAPSSASVVFLVKGVLTAMFLNKLKQLAAAALLCALAIGFGFGTRHLWMTAGAGEPQMGQQAPQLAAKAPAPDAGQEQEPVAAAAPVSQDRESIEGLWRVLKIDTRLEANMGEGPGGGEGGGAAGPRGIMGAFGGGPMGAGMPPGMVGPGSPAVSEGDNSRAFLYITRDQAVFTARGQKFEFQSKIGPGVIDWSLEDGRPTSKTKGVYFLKGNQLQLCFGPPDSDQAGPGQAPPRGARPKGVKDAREVWTLMRPPTRQQIYQRLDQLQGEWKAVSGEYNGEAFLPRELKSVSLWIRDGNWRMTPPDQPGQPDAVPRRFFQAAYDFVLDSDGARNLLILQGAGARPSEQRTLYELRGNELKVCWSTRWQPLGGPSETPKEFKTTPGSDFVLFVLKRHRDDSEPAAGQPGGAGGAAPGPQPHLKAGTVNEADNSKLVTRVVGVADLISREPGKESTALVQVITKTVEPTSWDTVGGPGSIEYFPEGKSFVINQTADVHARIMALLVEMRQTKAEQEKKQLK
jgi:RNA polymerase sigma factor (sigma-70 family)